jgi:hypothetical protein
MKKTTALILLSLSFNSFSMTSEDGLALALCTELSALKGKSMEEARHYKKLRAEFPADYNVRIAWAKKKVREIKISTSNFDPFDSYTALRCSVR